MAALLESASENVGRYRMLIEHEPSVIGSLSNVVRRLSPDLLVLGTRRRGRLERTLFGSTASRMLMTRGADVLVVPHRQLATIRRDENARRQRSGITAIV
jgi:nucleotide-binding universal stress UspA family protein